MSEQMIREVANDLAHAILLRVGLSAEVKIEWVKEEVTIELVAAGVGLPKPLAIGTFWPARFIDLPKPIALLERAVALETAGIGIRPVHGPDRPRHVTFRWGM